MFPNEVTYAIPSANIIYLLLPYAPDTHVYKSEEKFGLTVQFPYPSSSDAICVPLSEKATKVLFPKNVRQFVITGRHDLFQTTPLSMRGVTKSI